MRSCLELLGDKSLRRIAKWSMFDDEPSSKELAKMSREDLLQFILKHPTVDISLEFEDLGKREQRSIAEFLGIDANRTASDLAFEVHWYIDDPKGWKPSTAVMSSATKKLRVDKDALWACAEETGIQVLHLVSRRKGSRTAIWCNPKFDSDDENRFADTLLFDMRNHPDAECRENGILHILSNGYDYKVSFEAKEQLRKTRSGETSLYGLNFVDVPELPLLLDQKSPCVKAISKPFANVGWKLKNDEYLTSFPDQAAVKDFRNRYKKIHPIYDDSRSVYAQIGGFPITLPDGSALEQRKKKLVLRTYFDAEPWIEVFLNRGKYKLESRIT